MNSRASFGSIEVCLSERQPPCALTLRKKHSSVKKVQKMRWTGHRRVKVKAIGAERGSFAAF
jgi:hypothetical protein